EFKKIYILHPMQSVINNEIKQKDRLDKQDNQVFLIKLAQTKYYQQNCFSNRVDSNIALSRFLKIKAMSYTESNICFLEMIDASTKEDILVNGILKHGLVSKIYSLTDQISNSAISFTTVLYILKFITNFANQHGLPSP
ncbi:24790_t:CDS:2, partial [Cetraspora pellucida]